MERREYERLAAVEDRMWWFRGLHDNLVAAGGPTAGLALDAGCGTGGFLARLGGAGRAIGLDRDERACAVARAKSGASIVAGSVDALPFPDRAFDTIWSADVLCHRGVDEAKALVEFRRCLKPGGVLVLNLPAYRWLLSAHDRAVDNVRRYDRAGVLRLLAEAGFAASSARYWNSLLFPLMVLRRKLGPRDGSSEVTLLPPPVERVFGACLGLERALVAAGVRFPFGGSILATSVRP
ncbi:MAG TPA: class I SAM-dependent methyltransferase [Stellaceae bacterium]|nr:class I SAM-dependent methyltransferase [Stellaceae bacterium]